MKLVYLLVFSALAGCTNTSRTFSSPSARITLRHAANDEKRWGYSISDEKNSDWGRIDSVINSETRPIRKYRDTDQRVIWSPTESSAIIYENISDASPEYRHILVRFDYEQKKFKAYQLDLGIRRVSEDDIYGHWPSICYLTDAEIGLSWLSEPRESIFSTDKYIADFEKAVAQDTPPGPIY